MTIKNFASKVERKISTRFERNEKEVLGKVEYKHVSGLLWVAEVRAKLKN